MSNINTITPKKAHDRIISQIGKEGWFCLNDGAKLREIAGYAPDEYSPRWVESEDGSERQDWSPVHEINRVIEDAIDLLDNELVISISRTQSHIKSTGTRKKWRIGYVLNILPLGKGYVCGWDECVTNRPFYTLEECLNAIEACKDGVADKVSESKAFYITGDADAVEKVAEMFGSLSHIDLPNCEND